MLIFLLFLFMCIDHSLRRSQEDAAGFDPILPARSGQMQMRDDRKNSVVPIWSVLSGRRANWSFGVRIELVGLVTALDKYKSKKDDDRRNGLNLI